MRSPFKYPGSKDYAVKRLLPYMSTHTTFIEPFCGGASIFFTKPKAKSNWLNDIDAELINTYKVLRDNPEGLIEAINSTEVSKKNYDYFKRDFRPRNDLQRAFRWLYLDTNSYPDTINLVSNFLKFDSSSNTNMGSLTKRLCEASRKLQGVKLTSLDFTYVVRKAAEGAFLFIDPPYSLNNSPSKAKRYLNKFRMEDHLKLAAFLDNRISEIKFMLCYRLDPEAEKLYAAHFKMYKKILRFKVENSMPRTGVLNVKKKDYLEMIFTNYVI